MPQGALPFNYEIQRQGQGFTGLGGLPVYMDLAHRLKMASSIDTHVGLKAQSQGWTDSELVMSLIWLNLAGGDHVDDLKLLRADEGFCRLLVQSRHYGMKRRERRALVNRWRKERKQDVGSQAVPSPSAVFRYLSMFCVPGETTGVKGTAHIPSTGRGLRGLAQVNRDMLSAGHANKSGSVATLDMDATIVATHKAAALYCYKGYQSYQPFNVWWAETGMIVHTEFRDGNVPAGFDQLRILKESLAALPAGVDTVQVRSDTAGYQHDLLKYCDSGHNERFGRIRFAVGCDVTPEFKRAVSEVDEQDWQPLKRFRNGQWEETHRQWAEVCFVPNAIGHSKNGPAYRYVATREPLREQLPLDGLGQAPQYSFPTMTINDRGYKVFATVTNTDMPGDELLRWQYGRCGKSEEANRAIKHDFAGGKLPTSRFYENAAWWWIAVLAYNLNAIMKDLVMGGQWVKRKMKAIRFGLIRLPGQVVQRARTLRIRLSRANPVLEWIRELRARISALSVPV